MSDPNSQIGKWYRKPRWQRRAALQMKEHPLCAMCLGKSIVTAAKIADHIVPHKGNEAAFWFGALQSLCPSCHSGTKAVIEKRGYSDEIGANGYPVDRAHPFWKR